jgi:hypothetical protein
MVSKAADRLSEGGSEPSERQLALEIRSWRFGFAILQGDDLLEVGARRYPSGGAETAIKSLTFLIRLYRPSAVITRTTRRARQGSSQRASFVSNRIMGEVKRHSIRYVVVPRRDVRKFFASQGCRNKHEIATLLAGRFSQLKPRLPNRRRTWDPEWYAFALFDAVATAVTFNARNLGEVTKQK